VVNYKVFARLGVKALPFLARTGNFLLFAGLVPKVGRGSSHIVNIAFKARKPCSFLASFIIEAWLRF